MDFDWRAHMKDVSALRDEIARAKRYYKVLSDIDEDLLAKAQHRAEALDGTEQAVQALKEQELTLSDAIMRLESQYEAAKQRVEENVPGWEAELAAHQQKHAEAMAALEARYQARQGELEVEAAAFQKDMEAGMQETRKAHAAEIKALGQQTAEAQQKLAMVRKAMADLASSAAGA